MTAAIALLLSFIAVQWASVGFPPGRRYTVLIAIGGAVASLFICLATYIAYAYIAPGEIAPVTAIERGIVVGVGCMFLTPLSVLAIRRRSRTVQPAP